MNKLTVVVIIALIGIAACTTATMIDTKPVDTRPVDELIIEGQTTEGELSQILGEPSFYVTPELPQTGKIWHYVSWITKSDSKIKTIRKALVQDGIVIEYSYTTIVE